jgi:hypothetical protein
MENGDNYSTAPWSNMRRSACGDIISAFSYMVRQTNNSGLVSKLYMKRQANSGKKLCLGIQDKETKTHIK